MNIILAAKIAKRLISKRKKKKKKETKLYEVVSMHVSFLSS